jgi:hypothetical protein
MMTRNKVLNRSDAEETNFTSLGYQLRNKTWVETVSTLFSLSSSTEFSASRGKDFLGVYMKRHLITVISMVFTLSTISYAQLNLPRPSQKASVMQRVGITDVTITYSRPAVKGRKIFGDAPADSYAKGEATLDNQYKRPEGMAIVPYGHVWRTGANEATQFVITDDVMINGQKLAAGSYSLHTIPAKDEWTIVFNGTANQWGSFNYDPAKDTLRVKAKPQSLKENQEWMMFTIDPVTEDSATVNIRWEKVSVPFTVTVDTVGITMAKARPLLAAAKPDDWRIRYNVGSFAVEHKLTDEGMKLLSEALAIVDDSIKSSETYGNLAGRANILFTMGRKDEAFAAADKAIVFGKANKADTSALEKRVADTKAGRM